MSIDMRLLAYCGLYCEQCSARSAFLERDPRHLDAFPSQYRKARGDLSDYDCEGCKGRNLCGPCVIKDCASPRGFDHCGECPDFPCEKLAAFENDGMRHHAEAVENLRNIRENGRDAWFETLEPALQCHCGKRKSWYLGCPDHP